MQKFVDAKLRQDAIWFADNPHEPVLTFEMDEYVINVWVSGETEYYDHKSETRCRWVKDFESIGVYTDKDLDNLPMEGWEHNSWFSIEVSKNGKIVDQDLMDEFIFHSLGDWWEVLENILLELDND